VVVLRKQAFTGVMWRVFLWCSLAKASWPPDRIRFHTPWSE